MTAGRLVVVRRFVGAPGSRRRFIGLAAGLHTAEAPAATAARAKGRLRRQCRKRGGVYIRRGSCHCGQTCASITPCGHHAGCACRRTAEGRGFCVGLQAPSTGCSSTTECPSSFTCTVEFDCAPTGLACLTGADCRAINPTLGCIAGACQSTYCWNPCG